MKKILALVFVLLMLCTGAVAEEISSYYFDPAMVEGVDGYYALLEQFGIQLFVPSDFVAFEVSEADAARGVISVLGTEDGTMALSIAYTGVADANGNLITNLNDLYDFYVSQGVTDIELAMVNDLPALFYVLHDPIDYNNLAIMNAEGYMLSFNFLTNGDEELYNLSAALLLSVTSVVTE